MEQNYVQRGYLHEDFRLFHLRGAMEESVDWHYHTFHKIIEFLGGESGYGVEGKQYLLQPGDLVLVPQGCIHRPEAEPNAPMSGASSISRRSFCAARAAAVTLRPVLTGRGRNSASSFIRRTGQAARSLPRWNMPSGRMPSGGSCWRSRCCSNF